MLRAEAPQLRTAEAIIAKHEQIQDALEREAITGKVAEQMNQTLKGIMGLAKLELQSLVVFADFLAERLQLRRGPSGFAARLFAQRIHLCRARARSGLPRG